MLGIGCGVCAAAVIGTGLLSAGPAPASEGVAAAGVARAQLAYASDGRIYRLQADGSGRRLLVPPTSAESRDWAPAWSPDGSRVAVVHERDGEDQSDRSRLDVLASDGSDRRAITSLSRGVWVDSPRWSPDGTRLAFTRFVERSGRYTSAIVVHDLSTGAEQTVVRQRLGRRFASVGEPEWSPGGERLVYTLSRLDRRAYFRPSLHVAALEGTSARLLAREAHSAAFSPAGSRIAFVSVRDRNGTSCGSDECSYNGELYVMDSTGRNPRRLTRNPGSDGGPDWSPDGRRIAFASNRNFPDGAGSELYSIEPDGRCLTWLTNGTADSGDPTWHPVPGATEPAGCGATPRPALVDVDLSPARGFVGGRPLWLGTSYRGLLLSDVDGERHGLFFGYLDCDRYRARECPSGIQVLITSVCSPDAHISFLGDNSETIRRRRGALVADFGGDGLTVFTGGLEVHVVSEDEWAPPARAAFRALRRFPQGSPGEALRPPAIPAAFARALRRVTRAQRELKSVDATARRLHIARSTVRRRLKTAAALRRFGRGVQTVRC